MLEFLRRHPPDLIMLDRLVVKVKRNSDMTLDGLILSLRDLADSLEAGFSNIDDMIYGGGFVSKDVGTQREDSAVYDQDKEICE